MFDDPPGADKGENVRGDGPIGAFEVLPGEAHQPFQEVPEDFNSRVDAFWRGVQARG